jgi:hypothetical protein
MNQRADPIDWAGKIEAQKLLGRGRVEAGETIARGEGHQGALKRLETKQRLQKIIIVQSFLATVCPFWATKPPSIR